MSERQRDELDQRIRDAATAEEGMEIYDEVLMIRCKNYHVKVSEFYNELLRLHEIVDDPEHPLRKDGNEVILADTMRTYITSVVEKQTAVDVALNDYCDTVIAASVHGDERAEQKTLMIEVNGLACDITTFLKVFNTTVKYMEKCLDFAYPIFDNAQNVLIQIDTIADMVDSI